MRREKYGAGFVKQTEYDKLNNELNKKKKALNIFRFFCIIFGVLFAVSAFFTIVYSLEIYHWNPYEVREIGFTTSLSNRELKDIATKGKKVSIVGYLTTGYNEDIFLTSKPYTTPYYLGSDEMALYRNIKLDITKISNFAEGDLVRAVGYLTYDNYSDNVNGTTYNYKLKLTNPEFFEITENLGTYYNEYKKFQDSGALAIMSYCTTWFDFIVTGCYYQNYENFETLDVTLFDTCKNKMEQVDSELKTEYISALNTLKDSVERLNLLVNGKDYSGILAEVDELYNGFIKFDMITASVDISVTV